MATIICVAGHKGGGGKTTTAVNLAACLALYEFNTLLVDLDPLGFASAGLNDEPVAPEGTLSHAMEHGKIDASHIHPSALDLLHFIPADMALDPVARRLAAVPDEDFRLRAMLREVAEQYAFIVLDTPSRLNRLTLNAIYAADWLIVPQPVQAYAARGLEIFMTEIRRIIRDMNPGLSVAGVLPIRRGCEADAGDTMIRSILAPVAGLLFRTVIPWDIHFQKAMYRGRPLMLSDIASPASVAYMKFTRELLASINRHAGTTPAMPVEDNGMVMPKGSTEARAHYARMAASLATMMEDINKP